MIEILGLNGQRVQQFDNYNQLFDYLTVFENLKFISHHFDVKQMNWSFTIYSSKQVASLYAYSKNPDEAIREAFEEELPLIEICSGSYPRPLYIVNTPNVNMDYLKQKWCLDYCIFHDLIIRDYFKIFGANLDPERKGLSCWA